LLAVCSRADIGGSVRPWILKLERTSRWAAERAAIKAEIKRAKETVDLIGIAQAFTRLDALEATSASLAPDRAGKDQDAAGGGLKSSEGGFVRPVFASQVDRGPIERRRSS
jgi:hypothetical protein